MPSGVGPPKRGAVKITPTPQVSTCVDAPREETKNALASVGARHAVPGKRTWRDRAIHRDAEIRDDGETFEVLSAWLVRMCIWRVRARHAVLLLKKR